MSPRTIPSLAAAALACACSSSSAQPPGGSCASADACTPAGCARPVQPSVLPSTQVVELGTHMVGDLVNFTVPPGTESLTIIHQARQAGLNVVYQGQVLDNSAVPGTVTMPGGAIAYDDSYNPPSYPDGGGDDSGRFAFYGGGTPSTGALTMPSTSYSLDAGLAPGQWQFSVNDYAYECSAPNSGCSDGGATNDTYDVSVLLRPKASTASLDLAFYIVGNATTRAGVPLTAANAGSDPSVQRLVQTFTSIYAGAGIQVRTVSYYDASDADKARYGTTINADTTGPCDLLDQMFLMSSAHPANTVNLFLVQSITSRDKGGGSVVGIDGTIPGPATIAGTVHSGAAVSLANLFFVDPTQGGCPSGSYNLYGCGADDVAFIAAHETGHFLGLFHTTELGGNYFDPLTDTAKCPCMPCAQTDAASCASGKDASGKTIYVQAANCQGYPAGCQGGSNLMFWQLDQGVAKAILSPQQAAVIHLSPAVQ